MTQNSNNHNPPESKEILNIFIASSAELKREREKIILIFNSMNKYLNHLKLEPIKWETDIESGNVEKERIQDEINEKLEDCKIVILLFYSKVGKFTYEEYRLALEKQKKIFVYFKKGFPPKDENEIENYKQVLQLKKNIQKENRTLYIEYENIDQLRNTIQKDINLYISKNYSQSQREKTTELDEYLGDVKRIDANRKASTSAPLYEKTVNDLDQAHLAKFFDLERVIAEFLGETIDDMEEKLRHLRLLSPRKALLKGTFLCFGQYIDEICKTSSSKFFVFKDKKGIVPWKTEWLRGNLVTQYLKMLEHLKRNLYLVRDVYSDKEEDYEIPEAVFKELLANAFVHRDYSWDIKSSIQVELYPDRLEIKNPGTLAEEIDQAKIGLINMSYARNVEIQVVFFLYKFAEKAGSGICKIQEILKNEGFKPAGIEDDKRGRYVKAVIYKKELYEKENRKKASPPVKLLTDLPMRNIKLIGRHEELQMLEKRLKETDQLLLLNGLGGIGKTEVCKRFFLAHYRQFSSAGWIDYVSSIKESIVTSIKTSRIEVNEGDTLDERFEKILEFLNTLDENSLLVIDNIEDPEDKHLDTIKTLPFKVIANSRLHLEGFEVHTLDFLSAQSCKDLFYTYYKWEKDDEYVEKIIDLCGRHTLTVELLARTARNAAISIKSLYETLEKKGFNLNEVIGDKVHTFWHNERERKRFFNHLLRIFDLSNVTEAEMAILVNLSVLPSVYIGMNVLREWLKLENNEEMNALVYKGWLMQEEDGFRVLMHRVSQEIIRHKALPDGLKCRNLIDSLKWKLHLEPGENPIEKREFIIFAESLLRYIDEDNSELASLSNNLGGMYWDLGQLEKALEFLLKSLKIREKILDKNHPDLATSYNNLSQIYQDLGQMEKALEFQEKALKIREKVLDKNHPSLATSYNNLSLIYKALGQMEHALEFQLKTVKIFEKILDKSHPSFANSYNNLSIIYQDLGQMEKALEFQEKAAKIYEAVLDRDHPSLATFYNNLSLIYQDLGQMEHALEFQLKTLEIKEKILDKNHPSLATSYNNLSTIYRNLGQLEKALEFQGKAVKIWEKVLDKNHPALATSYNNLALIYHELKDYKKALLYAQQAVDILQHLFPNGHPNLDIMKKNLKSIRRMAHD